MFDLAMPYNSKKFRAYTIIQFATEWQVCMIRTRIWKPRQYMDYWLSEADALVDNHREVALFPVSVYMGTTGNLFPGERWCLFRDGNQVKMNLIETVNENENSSFSTNPTLWWKSVKWSDFPSLKRSGKDKFNTISVSELSDWVTKERWMLTIVDDINSDSSVVPW